MAQSELAMLTEAVKEMSGKIDGFTTETQELHDYGRENRRLIRRQNRIILGVVLLALAVGLVGVIAIRGANEARAAARAAQTNAENAYGACLKANQARATTRDLWDNIFSQPSVQKLSPAEQATRDTLVAALRARIARDYADQDCSKLGPQPVKK